MQSFQWKFIILCPETVSRNLPVPRNLPESSLNVPNRHKKSNSPKKAKFHLAFFQKYKKAKGVEKRPKITNLVSKKQNWQPWSRVDCFSACLFFFLAIYRIFSSVGRESCPCSDTLATARLYRSLLWHHVVLVEVRAVASGEASGALPPFEIGTLHFTFGPPVAAYIQYCILKISLPFWFWAPPSGFWPPLLLHPGDGSGGSRSSSSSIWSISVACSFAETLRTLVTISWFVRHSYVGQSSSICIHSCLSSIPIFLDNSSQCSTSVSASIWLDATSRSDSFPSPENARANPRN